MPIDIDSDSVDLYDEKNYQGGYDASRKLAQRQRLSKGEEHFGDKNAFYPEGKVPTGTIKKMDINKSY